MCVCVCACVWCVCAAITYIIILSSLSPSIATECIKASMCSSLKAIEASMDEAPEVKNLRCTTDTTRCLTLDCNFNYFIGATVPSRLKITLEPCAPILAVKLNGWVLGSRVVVEKYTRSTDTSFTVSEVTTRMAVTVTQEDYGVIFGVS